VIARSNREDISGPNSDHEPMTEAQPDETPARGRQSPAPAGWRSAPSSKKMAGREGRCGEAAHHLRSTRSETQMEETNRKKGEETNNAAANPASTR